MDIDNPGSDTLGLPVSNFSVKFPLPYRVLFLLGLGGACWATNLQILGLAGIDAAQVLQTRSDSPSATAAPLPLSRSPSPQHVFINPSYSSPHSIYTSIYEMISVYLGLVGLSWVLFSLATGGDRTRLDDFKIIPAFTTVVILCAAIMPISAVHKLHCSVLYKSLWRCFSSPPTQPVHFSDVIVADILTSFAKVLGDLWIFGVTLLPGGSLRSQPKAQGLSEIAIPLLMSFPYVVRFRQCVVEYMGSSGDSRRPLYNAAKYATAFPVILLSASQRPIVDDDQGNSWRTEYPLFRMWVIAVLVNSVYSFWWDVTNDWGLSLLLPRFAPPHLQTRGSSPLYQGLASSEAIDLSTNLHSRKQSVLDASLLHPSPHTPSTTPGSPFRPSSPIDLQNDGGFTSSAPSRPPRVTPGLRHPLLFQEPVIYYLAIFFNFLLRFTWSLKLSSHLHTVAELESGVFLMEALELIRRWMWVFLRIEWEAVKKGYKNANMENGFIVDECHRVDAAHILRVRPEELSMLPLGVRAERSFDRQ